MAIPAFDANLVLPPHLGNPTQAGDLSPYPCTTVELCHRFGSTPERRKVLEGLLQFRSLLRSAGFEGFQWLDGSFLEDIEKRENRPPKDLDIVTLYGKPDTKGFAAVKASQPQLFDRAGIKTTYSLDHYYVDIAYNPILTVESTRYWIGLFSHRRDGIWKGMLRIELATVNEDADAEKYLRSVS